MKALVSSGDQSSNGVLCVLYHRSGNFCVEKFSCFNCTCKDHAYLQSRFDLPSNIIHFNDTLGHGWQKTAIL